LSFFLALFRLPKVRLPLPEEFFGLHSDDLKDEDKAVLDVTLRILFGFLSTNKFRATIPVNNIHSHDNNSKALFS
jgi:hypothetical protein